MQKTQSKRKIHPPQQQSKPGLEHDMVQKPVFDSPATGTGKKLSGKAALITGGDSGIGRAIAVAFAKHGADVAICYLKEEKTDAKETAAYVSHYGKECLLIEGDLTDEAHCKKAVSRTVKHFGRLDVLVNNASTHEIRNNIEDISSEQLLKTFHTNVFSMFYLVKAAIKHLKEGSCIINTGSVTAYRGSGHLMDYAATKGAIISFTRSLASSLLDKKIRVNAVAPGPVWTPLIVSSLEPEAIQTFGSDSPMGRAGQPAEIASCYVFLASAESSYMTGQVLHPNGGEIVNG